MKIEQINSPEIRLNTVREQGYSGCFRPSATGNDTELLHRKLSMEKLEIVASEARENDFISCAAHESKSLSILNAKFEAIERLSVASWWALDRPWKRPINEATLNYFSSFIDDVNFSINGGYIESVCETGTTCIVIIKNENKYPLLVLGSSYGIDEAKVAENAFFEAAQSWIASDWLSVNHPYDAPNWDSGHLRRRFNALEKFEVSEITCESVFETLKMDGFFHDKKIITEKFSAGYVTWVYLSEPIPAYNYEVADLFRQTDEVIKVYTQCNF